MQQHFNPTFNPEVEAWQKYMLEHGDMPIKDSVGRWVRPSEIIYELTHTKVYSTSSNFITSSGGKF